MYRCPKSHLDLLHPNITSQVNDSQECQKRNHDVHAKPRSFHGEDLVFVSNTGRGPKWIEGVVEQQTGPLSFLIRLTDGRRVRKHMDQLRARLQGDSPSTDPQPVKPIVSEQMEVFGEIPAESIGVVLTQSLRRSTRRRRPPVRFS